MGMVLNCMHKLRRLNRVACLIGLLVMVLCMAPSAVMALEKSTEVKPSWSLGLKGGHFKPAIPDWETYYGDDTTTRFAASLAYKFLNYFELGVEGGQLRDRGQGYLPLNNTVTGNVNYALYPLNVYVLVQGIFYQDQWLIPYVGGGWTRAYYNISISNQDDIKGSVDGTHVKGGLRVLLDGMAKGDARNLQAKYGIDNTYFFLEFQTITAKADVVPEVDIGGDSYLFGVLFEY